MKFKSTVSIIAGVLAISASFNCFAKWENFRTVHIKKRADTTYLTRGQIIQYAKLKADQLKLGMVRDTQSCSNYPFEVDPGTKLPTDKYMGYKNTMLCYTIGKRDKVWHIEYKQYRLVF